MAAAVRRSPDLANGSSNRPFDGGARRASRKHNPAAPTVVDYERQAAYEALVEEGQYSGSASGNTSNTQPGGQTGRSFSARARDSPSPNLNYTTRKPTLNMPPVRQEESTTPRGLPPIDYADPNTSLQGNEPSAPLPAAHAGSSLPSPPSRSNTTQSKSESRRDWASDRSPLQKLEVTLNGISKEEKRARVQEAEMRLRERLAHQKAEREKAESAAMAAPPVAERSIPAQPHAAPEPTRKMEPQDINFGNAPMPRPAGAIAVRHNRAVSMNPQYPAIRTGEAAHYARAEAATQPPGKARSVPQRSVTLSGPVAKQGPPSDRIAHSRSVSRSIPPKAALAMAGTAAVSNAERIETSPAARAAQGSVDSQSKPKREKQTVSFNVPPPTPPPIFEWKTAPIARLGASDFDFQHVDLDRGKAWWEGGGTVNRRKSRALPKNYQSPSKKTTGGMVSHGPISHRPY